MSENFSENEQVDEIEEIEFDDNIDIEALQKSLQQHMAEGDVVYNPATEEKEPEKIDAVQMNSENSLVPAEQTEDNIDEINEFFQSVEGTGNTNVVPQDENIAEISENKAQNKPREEKQKLQLGEKKYIVYVEQDNVDFMDALTINERKSVINRILREEDAAVKKRRQIQERIKFINQVIIMVVTVVVSLPIFFIILNKSIEVTILNYQQSQQNFVKLYKEQGKIKSYKKFQKTFD